MQFPEALQPFLRKHRISVLTVVNEAGDPHGATLHYAFDEQSGSFLFFTRKHTLKYKAVENGAQKSSLVIGFSEEEFATIQLHGEAKTLENKEATEVYFKKYPHTREWANEENSVFLEFIPTWFRYTDLKLKEPIVISSDDSSATE